MVYDLYSIKEQQGLVEYERAKWNGIKTHIGNACIAVGVRKMTNR